MPSINNLWSIVLAAGRSSRLRKTGIKQKKQFLEYKGFPLFVHSLVKFSSIPLIQGIVLVVAEEDFELVQTLLVS
ncbi:2-C-methyl-D-erythritol 4-phosphate cytidylyltransferase, partial [Desulfonauticus submarinus]